MRELSDHLRAIWLNRKRPQPYESARQRSGHDDALRLHEIGGLWLAWDDFTRLFFYDPDSVYLIGLDPTFMSLPEPALYAE